MKKFFPLLLIVLISCSLQNQKKEQNNDTEYLSIYFESICCGAPNNIEILNFTQNYFKNKKLYSPKIYKHSGLGFEGEYRLYISLKSLNLKQKEDFLKKIQKNIDQQNSKRDSNSTGIIQYGQLVSEEKMNTESKIKHFEFTKFEEINLAK